jgi:AraC-like DNA-binding protein
VDATVLLSRRTASSAEGASDAIAGWLGEVTLTASPGPFAYEHRSLADDGVTVTRFSCTGRGVELRCPRLPDLVAVVVREGEVLLERGDDTARIGREGVGLLPYGAAVTLRWDAVSADAFSLASSSVAGLLGVLGRPLRLASPHLTPISPTLETVWRDTARLLASRVLVAAEAYDRDLLRTQMIAALTASTIEAFGLSEQTEDVGEDRRVQVRARAEAFMRARLREPIGIPDIARAAGVSIRGLQLAYQRHGDISPIIRLRQLRMEAARSALERAEPVSVAAVARQFGYSNAGRFAAHYRNHFGEPPSATLDRRRSDGSGRGGDL